MTRIYVGNLSSFTTEIHLKPLFEQFGKVSRLGILQEKSGRSRGFGFVLMSNDREGQNAILNLNGRAVNGRPLDVQEALPPASTA